MIRFLVFIFLFINAIVCYSQSISVASFKLLDSDLTANTTGTMEQDQNGETAALLKIVTTQTGFTFDGGSLGVVKTIQKPSEIWVYVPRGSKKITIAHPQLGMLRDYYYPIAIEAARTYEMVLTTGSVQTIIKQVANSQYLVLKVTPIDAVVELDNEILPTSEGIAQKFVKMGTYEYRVQAPNYHTSAGKVTIDDPNNKKVLEISLSPAFGWIEVQGDKELEGAQVFIDNALVGTIPMKSNNLASGKHNVKVVKSLYQPYSQTVEVSDNQTTQITPQLNTDYSIVTINVANDADIYVNNEKKGSGTWIGKLGTGTYLLEAKKEGHQSTTINVDISSKQPQRTINLNAPIPIYGSVNITSTPSMADIYVDGKNVGQTPLVIRDILVGEHNLRIEREGYDNYSANIIVSNDDQTSVNITLYDESLYKIKLNCNVPSAILYVDDKKYGLVSDNIRLSKGKHKICLTAEGYEDIVKEISVFDTDVTSFNNYNISMEPFLVRFRCDKSNPYVSIDNGAYESWGNSNTLKLSKGWHKIAIRHKGCKEINDSIVIKKGNEDFLISFKKSKILNSEHDFDNYIKELERIEKEYRMIETKKQTDNWEFIQLTNNWNDVKGMINVGDVTQKFNNSTAFESLNEKNRQRCIKRMKKAAAKMGAKVILLGNPYQGGLLNSFCVMPGTAYK